MWVFGRMDEAYFFEDWREAAGSSTGTTGGTL